MMSTSRLLDDMALAQAAVLDVHQLIAHQVFLCTPSPWRQLRLHGCRHLATGSMLNGHCRGCLSCWAQGVGQGGIGQSARAESAQLLHMLRCLRILRELVSTVVRGWLWHPVCFEAHQLLGDLRVLVQACSLSARKLEILAVCNCCKGRLGILAVHPQPILRVSCDLATVHSPHCRTEVRRRHRAVSFDRNWAGITWARVRHPVLGHVPVRTEHP
mmetsp:Transcript_730/g.1608  ORF Transcript_730/g.1608 Transcript_730/m.1608 type:complete len:215 (-) Transcript_730:589-1233(-)